MATGYYKIKLSNKYIAHHQRLSKSYSLLRILNRSLFCIFFLGAGINHFWHPQGYIDLIPPYLPAHALLNVISGGLEISGSILMIIPQTRKISAILIIVLLIAFIPAHIYLIQMKGCVSARMCIAEWLAWIRLPLQFILIWWVWKTYK